MLSDFEMGCWTSCIKEEEGSKYISPRQPGNQRVVPCDSRNGTGSSSKIIVRSEQETQNFDINDSLLSLIEEINRSSSCYQEPFMDEVKSLQTPSDLDTFSLTSQTSINETETSSFLNDVLSSVKESADDSGGSVEETSGTSETTIQKLANRSKGNIDIKWKSSKLSRSETVGSLSDCQQKLTNIKNLANVRKNASMDDHKSLSKEIKDTRFYRTEDDLLLGKPTSRQSIVSSSSVQASRGSKSILHEKDDNGKATRIKSKSKIPVGFKLRKEKPIEASKSKTSYSKGRSEVQDLELARARTNDNNENSETRNINVFTDEPSTSRSTSDSRANGSRNNSNKVSNLKDKSETSKEQSQSSTKKNQVPPASTRLDEPRTVQRETEVPTEALGADRNVETLALEGHKEATASDVSLRERKHTLEERRNLAPEDFCRSLLKELMSTKNQDFTWPFMEPMDLQDLEVFSYNSMATRSTDFKSIKKKFVNRMYKTLQEFSKDIRLIYQNCLLCAKPGSDIFNMAMKLKEFCEEEFTNYSKDEQNVELYGVNNTKEEDDRSVPDCPICFQKRRDAVFIPCGHTTCMDCATRIRWTKNVCPHCRSVIQNVNPVYLS